MTRVPNSNSITLHEKTTFGNMEAAENEQPGRLVIVKDGQSQLNVILKATLKKFCDLKTNLQKLCKKTCRFYSKIHF